MRAVAVRAATMRAAAMRGVASSNERSRVAMRGVAMRGVASSNESSSSEKLPMSTLVHGWFEPNRICQNFENYIKSLQISARLSAWGAAGAAPARGDIREVVGTSVSGAGPPKT